MLNISLDLGMQRRKYIFSSLYPQTSIRQELEETMAERERDLNSLLQELEQARKNLEERDQNLRNLREMVDALTREKETCIAEKEKVKFIIESFFVHC